MTKVKFYELKIFFSIEKVRKVTSMLFGFKMELYKQDIIRSRFPVHRRKSIPARGANVDSALLPHLHQNLCCLNSVIGHPGCTKICTGTEGSSDEQRLNTLFRK